MYFLPYNKNLKEFSRDLRSHSTLSEILLWQKLRASQFRGYAFNRQKLLGNYIVDFYCRKMNLVIEVDGNSHFFEESVVEDLERQKVIEKEAETSRKQNIIRAQSESEVSKIIKEKEINEQESAKKIQEIESK